MNVKYTETKLSSDLDSIINLVSSSFSSTPDSSLDEWLSFSEMKKMINQGKGVCIKAHDSNGNLVGMIYAQQESPINNREGTEKWVIIVIAIHPDLKGKGIGFGLLNKIEVYAKKKGVKKMFVFTNKGDDKVINFYKKNKYENAGLIKDYQYGNNNSAVFLLKYL